VYRLTEGEPVFQPACAATAEQLHGLLDKIIVRVMRLLTRRGLLIEEHGEQTLAAIEADPALSPLQWASCTYRIALGPRAGQKLLSLQTLSARSEPASPGLCAKAHGFSLHAGLRCEASQRRELEQLCRYITRPAIAKARLSRTRTGQVVLRLKTPYTDGTTHVVMSPLEFLQRLAALVPRPRLHLIRFHGVLAPHAKLRALVIPPAADHDARPCTDHARPAPVRTGWARLLKRVFQFDLEHYPRCAGTLKIIAAIEDPAVIFAILTHLNLPARAPPRAPARALPLFQAA
jgi:hypothetical protein